jgi:ATP-dependent Lon protease
MRGKGEIKLTGQLGDVMKESALAALSFIRAHADKYGIEDDKFTTTDLHIHVPEGATPKDGPSAGITIATAILSVFTGRKVRGDIAMTGEITLRGRVLPIGGLKEKSLAARRLGIKTVVIPYENATEIPEFPQVLRDEITFVPVKRVDEVFDLLLEGGASYHEYSVQTTEKPRKKRASKTLPVLEKTENHDSVRCQ